MDNLVPPFVLVLSLVPLVWPQASHWVSLCLRELVGDGIRTLRLLGR